MTRFGRIAPTLAPPSATALAHGLAAAIVPSLHAGTLAAGLRALFPGMAVHPTGSGRAALAAGIAVAMRATGRDRVVLPAFTSFSVAAAATAAGAQVDLCDLDPLTLGLDRASLAACVGPRTAAVVLGNLYGFPDVTSDLGWLEARGVVLIDDAAQALGAAEDGRLAGARGALGVLSFGRGKCVTLGDAGALLVRDPSLRPQAEALAPAGRPRGAGAWAMAAATTLATSPTAFGALSRLPGIRVGESWYEPAFHASGVSAAADGLAVDLGAAVERQLAARRRVARLWMQALSGVTGLRSVGPAARSEPAYLRVPVLARDAAARDRLVSRLADVRFTFVRSFPCALGRLTPFGRERCADRATPGADDVAARIVALPCHGAVREADVRRAAASWRDLAAADAPTPSALPLTR